MLRLSAGQTLFQPQPVTVERIVGARSKLPWQPSAAADVLVLGDSFSSIFSSDQMGWGDSAGFVEHLAYYLGRPLDRLIRNDAGAHATRELACGDWKLLPLVLGERKMTEFYAPGAGLGGGCWAREVTAFQPYPCVLTCPMIPSS